MPGSKTPDQPLLIDALAYGLYWVDESLQATLQALGWDNLNRTKSMIMLNLASGICRPAQLATNIGISRQAIHQMLQEMKQDGLIVLLPDPDDRRAKKVEFSPRARTIRADAIKALAAIEEELARRIGERRLKQLKDGLNRDFGPIYTAPLKQTTKQPPKQTSKQTAKAKSVKTPRK